MMSRSSKKQQKRSAWSSLFGCCVGSGGKKTGSGKVGPGSSSRRIKDVAADAVAALGQRLSFTDVMSAASDQDLSVSLVGSNLHVFTVGELKAATQGFLDDNFLGEGGFGPVYKGSLEEKAKPGLKAQSIAVKLWDPEGTQGHKEWLAEVIFLGQFRHANLVKLIGYCCEDENRLLVYEYMPKGSLENHLFRKFSPGLSWSTRLNIAVGAAKGLAFLHDADKPVIYRDFKTSNILLDPDYKAKLSDFGLAKDGPEGDATHVSTRVMGTHGYAAPEYILTGHLTSKSDVYSFGVVLLEILSGRRAVDKTRPTREHHLVEHMRSWLKDPQKLGRIMDPALEGKYSAAAAHRAAMVAYQCLSGSPKSRPDMSKVVEELEPLLSLTDDVPSEAVVYVASQDDARKERATRRRNGERESGNGGYRHKARSPKKTVRRRGNQTEEFWEWNMPGEGKV
ncbi:hypothetical protein QYE76_067370 [Lolium multiflorum]|uniref:non-specific serine/threonine protein kinase n=1 Tax=Lolium multiflorum TaxID=4521 RepID=A0AAD8WBL3_LOLMU|nr:serine/threonine-protein kinase RIPK-like [Lolium perenne]KAK1649565.1 hypothetical protein QYE76_067370 [Lolium multiflorum]